MIGGLQGEFGDLDNKYLKQNISKSRSEISGSFGRTLQLCMSDGVSATRGSGHVWPGKLKRPPLPSGVRRRMWDIRSEDPDMSDRGSWNVRRTEFFPGWNELCLASLSGATPSGFPKRTRGALLYPDSLREKHTALANITPRTIAYPIRICCPDH